MSDNFAGAHFRLFQNILQPSSSQQAKYFTSRTSINLSSVLLAISADRFVALHYWHKLQGRNFTHIIRHKDCLRLVRNGKKILLDFKSIILCT